MSNPYAVTDEIVDDILCAAMEGGSNYWTDRVSVVGAWPAGAEYASDVLTKGGTLRWIESDDFTQTAHTLTLPMMKRGIRKAAAHFGLTVERFYEEHDAGSADVAVQMALFKGEVVYG